MPPDALADDGLLEEVGKISVPTLVVWGHQDRFLPVSHGELVVSRIPDATLHLFDQCGHSAQEDRPDLLADLLVRTFASETAAPE